MAEVRLTPGRPGLNRVRIALSGSGGSLAPRELTVRLSNKAAGIEPIERRATSIGPGEWEVDGLVLPVPGQWEAEIDALISDFEKAVLTGSIDVRR